MHLNWAQNSVKISPECINFSQKFFKKFLGRRHSTDQGASEIGLLTESSTATAQSAQCNVPVAASSSIGKRPRSKTLKAVPKKSLGRGHSPLPRPYPRWGGDTNSPYSTPLALLAPRRLKSRPHSRFEKSAPMHIGMCHAVNTLYIGVSAECQQHLLCKLLMWS